MSAVKIAPEAVSTIQKRLILRAVFASPGERKAMKRTMMCGCPKYPNPHAAVDIVATIHTKALPENPENRLKASCLTSAIRSVASDHPPSSTTVTIGTAMSAASMRRPWATSVRVAPRKPPNRV